MSKNKHEFAFFIENKSGLIHHEKGLTIIDKELVFRLLKIIRIQQGDRLVLFDDVYSYAGHVATIKANAVELTQCVHKKHEPLEPRLTWYLPLLEREAFEESLTALTVMGVAEIYPVVTQKSRHSWGSVKERERAKRLMISAAEQSKQFMIPIIHQTIDFNNVSQKPKMLFFDVNGQSAYDVITLLKNENNDSLCAMVGPEGDLTSDEKEILRRNGVIFVALTPTVLRASTAVCVSLGLMRSLL